MRRRSMRCAAAIVSNSLFKTEEARAYDEAAERFADLSERHAKGFAAHLVELAGVKPGDRVLDVGTGTGLVAAAAAERAGAGGRIVGIDISEAMVRRARERAAAGGLGERVEYRLLDAEALTLPDESFDVVVSLFALLHLPAPQRALGEMRRVLRVGGRAAVGVGSGAPWPWARLAQGVRRLGTLWSERRGRRLVAPGALEALMAARLGPDHGASAHWDAHARDHAPQALRGLMTGAGFADVRASWRGRDTAIPTAGEFWDVQRTFSSRARRRLSEAPASFVEDLRRQMEARSEAVLGRGGHLVYPQGVLFLSAVRPAR
jgi:SAM-dependent methyltransferase